MCVTRTRIRILESGSIKCTSKHKTQKDSGSGPSPDPRIIPKLKANASGSGFLNPDSGIFFMRTPDSHRIRTVSVRIHSFGTNRALLMFCRGAWHLDYPPKAYAMPMTGPNANRSGWSPQSSSLLPAHYASLPLPLR